MNDILCCKNDTLNMYHLKNIFINELVHLVITLTMLIVGIKFQEFSSNQEKEGHQKKSQ